MKTRLFYTILFVVAVLFWGKGVLAQQAPLVDYQGQPAVDSDLDGLSDKGETDVYGTNPQKYDTDGDSYGDGAEIISGTNSLDSGSYPGGPSGTFAQAKASSAEAPWPWYTSRGSALIGFLLLYISIFLGLAIRMPLLNKILKPVYLLNVHRWISVQALVFVSIHGLILLLDKFIGFGWKDIFIPFYSKFNPILVGLGIVSFYLMIVLIVTSYARQRNSYKIWRYVHSLNIFLYIFALSHALNLGTDLKNGILRNIFIGANILLAGLFIENIIFRLYIFFKRKITNENLP